MPEDKIILTPEQEQLILDTWNKSLDNPPSLKELCQLVFGPNVDGKGNKGLMVKTFLAKHNLKARNSAEMKMKSVHIQLTEQQQLHIQNNSQNNSPTELAREIFQNPNLSNLSAEVRVVSSYLKSLNTNVFGGKNVLQDIPDSEYTPPNTLDKILKKVNEVIPYVESKDKLNAQQRKNLEVLMQYLQNYRFITMMNELDSMKDRKLCEVSLIRYTYDKPDLTQEEVDQYIELANQIVLGFKVQRRSELLQQQLENAVKNTDDDKDYSMKLVEAIGKASTEYHQCLARQDKLTSNLTQRRSARLDQNVKDTASVLNLIQLWKEEETRKKMLKYVMIEQENIAKEVDKLFSMSELKARILGLTRDEIKYE